MTPRDFNNQQFYALRTKWLRRAWLSSCAFNDRAAPHIGQRMPDSFWRRFGFA